MAKVKAFKEHNIQELTEYYDKRGGLKVESVSDSPIVTHIEVTDIRGDNPIGWIIQNRFYYESSGEIVDPIHDCTISSSQLIDLLGKGEDGKPATVSERPDIDVIYVNIGCWKDSCLTLTGLDDATEIMFSIYYGRENFSQLFLHQIKPVYRSKMAKARNEEAETPRRHARSYERIVLPLPQDLEAYSELLRILEKLRKKQYDRMQECVRYLDGANILRKKCNGLGRLAGYVNCAIDTKTDPFHVILRTPEEGAMMLKYSDGIVDLLVDELGKRVHNKPVKTEEVVSG